MKKIFKTRKTFCMRLITNPLIIVIQNSWTTSLLLYYECYMYNHVHIFYWFSKLCNYELLCLNKPILKTPLICEFLIVEVYGCNMCSTCKFLFEVQNVIRIIYVSKSVHRSTRDISIEHSNSLRKFQTV